MRRLAAVLVLVVSLSGLSAAQKKQCFYINGQQAVYPNGAGAPTNYPCDPDADDSPCCGGEVGTVCLSNKLCRGPDGNLIRGSCTDKTWGSPGCPGYCMSATRGGTDLISCANVTGTDTSYCCDGHRAFCCDDGVARFEVLPSNPEVIARWDAASSQFVAVQRAAASSSSSPPSSATPSPSTTADPPNPNPNPNPSATAASDASAQTAEASQPAPPPAALSVGAQAGIGVGAGVLAIALATVAFLLWKLRKKKALLAELESHHHYRQPQQPQVQAGGPAPVYDDKADGTWYGGGGAELASARTAEMDGRGARFELPSTPGPHYVT